MNLLLRYISANIFIGIAIVVLIITMTTPSLPEDVVALGFGTALSALILSAGIMATRR